MAAGGSVLLVALGAGVAGVTALTRSGDPAPRVVTEVAAPAAPALSSPPALPEEKPHAARPHAAAVVPRERPTVDRPAPRRAPAPALPPAAAPVGEVASSAPAKPVLTTRTEVETREIPYETRLVRDPALPRGTKKVQSPGTPGVETLHYLVTLTDGKPTDRKLIDAVVTRQPEHRVVAFGSRPDAHPATRGNCGEALNFCVPLGRSATCPREEDAITPALDELAYLEGLAC